MNRLCLSRIQHVIADSFLCSVYKSSASPGFAQKIMCMLISSCYNGSLVITATNFKLLVSLCLGSP
jgi:hypothetical protein